MRIVLAPWGSLGDLHPYLAVALEMKRRGHDAVIATSSVYREKVEGEGLVFHPVRPEMGHYVEDAELMARVMDRFRGPEFLFRQILIPALRDMYADLDEACRGADFLVGHVAMCAAPLVAEARSLPWASAVLQPAVLWSAYDPPYFPVTGNLFRVSPFLARQAFRLARAITQGWMRPLYRFRRELGLSELKKHPLFEGQFSPHGTLALFSRYFSGPQPDWPVNTTATGFPFYDKLEAASETLDPELERFLESGEPPFVFTLGSSAVWAPGGFYETSLQAVQCLKGRAVLLAGLDFERRTSLRSSGNTFVTAYARFSQLFPRAAAVVHSGGVGTTAQALRAGRPQLIMPFSHDQPDNGARITRLGVGRMIPRPRYTAHRAAKVLKELVENPAVLARAGEVGQAIRGENGAAAAADALERIMRSPASIA